jgi:hypothetical protein
MLTHWRMSLPLQNETTGRERHRRIFFEVAEQCCGRLFASYGYALRPCASGELASGGALTFFGIIGFMATGLHGSLVLGSSDEPLTLSNPARAVPIREWIGELSNQLVGRMKNQLLLHALELRVDTPVTLRDTHMTEARTRGLPSLSLKGSSGLVRVWIDLQLGRGFHMTDDPDPSRAGPQESQTVIL